MQTSPHWFPSFRNLISLHPVFVWSTDGYTKSVLFFALHTSGPAVCKRSVFLQFCDQIQSSMHQIFTNNNFYRTFRHVHDFSRPQINPFCTRPTSPTHRQSKHYKLQNEQNQISCPSHYVVSNKVNGLCPAGKRSRTSAVKSERASH